MLGNRCLGFMCSDSDCVTVVSGPLGGFQCYCHEQSRACLLVNICVH